MATDFGEKERAFIDGLKENTGRDLGEWMQAIAAEALPNRNDIIDWLRHKGFMFSKASWLERIHHNGGRPIYADSPKGTPRTRRAREAPPGAAVVIAQARAAPTLRIVPAGAAPPPPSPPLPADDLEPLLAKAKAYRPLAQHLLARIKSVRPETRFLARDGFISMADPGVFAALGISPKELRLHLALGDQLFEEPVKKGQAGAGLGKGDALSHMVVLTDARQIDQRLLDLIGRAAGTASG